MDLNELLDIKYPIAEWIAMSDNLSLREQLDLLSDLSFETIKFLTWGGYNLTVLNLTEKEYLEFYYETLTKNRRLSEKHPFKKKKEIKWQQLIHKSYHT